MGVDNISGSKASAFNQFLSTQSGKAIVDGWTANQANYLIAQAPSARISDTTYFSVLSEDEQLAVAAATYKANNARGDLPGRNLVKFMNGETVNGIKIELTDSAAEIVDKFRQVVQTNIGAQSGPHMKDYGSTAWKAVLASFDKATKLSDVFNSAEFADAKAYLDNPANDISGAGASAQVQTQLSVLRVASMHIAEVTQSGQPIRYEGRLFTDPATGNRVVYSNSAAMVTLPNQQGGWLMLDGQMIRYQDGEVSLRLQPNPTTGLLQVSAVLPGKNGASDTAIALGPQGGYSVNPGFNAQNASPTYMEDGTLALVSGQGSAKVLALLNGPFEGSTVAYLDRTSNGSGGALRNVSFSSDNNNPSNNYYAVIDDGKGGVVTRDVRPITANTDAGVGTIIGSESTVVKQQNGITLSSTKTSTETDLATGQLVSNNDVTQYAPTGEFVSRSVNTITSTSSGIQLADVKVTFNAAGSVTQTSVTQAQPDGTTLTTVRDGQGVVQSATARQTLDDGSVIEIKTENGQQYVRATDTDSKASEWKNLDTGQTQTAEQRAQRYENQLYSDMAGFLNALRTKDKVNQVLYGAKIAIDYQMMNGADAVNLGGLNLGKTVAGLSATVGIVAGLHALQSNDIQTQLNGVVGLLYSANSLAGIMGVTHDVDVGKTAEGFLSEGSLQTLQQAGALLSIANLRNLDKMLENGQVGSAFATLVGAINGFALLTSAGTGATALIAINPLVMIGVVFVLDTMFSKSQTPPPPPPVGWAEFTRNPQGLQYLYHGTTPSGQDMPGDKAMGNSILQSAMDKVLTSLNKQLTDANATVTDPSRALVTIASRLPKVFIQSWLSKEGNGETNYYYYLEMTHPQTGQKYGAQVARQDIVNQYTGMSMAPEAIVQQWQAAHLAAKFGSDESKWLTEGQWAMAQSPIEQQRAALTKAYKDSYQALSALKNTELQAAADGLLTDGADPAALLARTQAIAAQQVKVDAAYKALVVFSTKNPLGFVGEQSDAEGHLSEGIAPQAAAMVVDGFTQANLASLETTDPQAWQSTWSKARQSASQQWMKAITLDWNGDGQISKWMPTEIAAGSDSSANAAKKFNVGTMLKDLQSDGYARFDVDGDGYREVTEWVAASDALDFNRACAHRNASRSRIGFFDQGQLRRSNTHAQP